MFNIQYEVKFSASFQFGQTRAAGSLSFQSGKIPTSEALAEAIANDDEVFAPV